MNQVAVTEAREPQVIKQAAIVNELACNVAAQIERLVCKITPILAPESPQLQKEVEGGRPEEVLPQLAADLRSTGDILSASLHELQRTISRVEV